MVKCEICKKNFETYRNFSSHLRSHNISSKEYYDKYLKKENEGICHNCGNITQFRSLKKGYNKFCSIKCSAVNENTKKKRVMTNLKNSGVTNPMKLDKTKEKIEETCLSKYGVKNASQSNEIKEKKRQTCLELYGVSHPSKLQEVKDKINSSLLNKHKNHPLNNRKKIQETWIRKYGVDNPLKSKKVRQKIKKTNLEIYGVEYPMQNSNVKLKYQKTMTEKFSCHAPTLHPLILRKILDSKKKNFFEKLFFSSRLRNKCIPNFNIESYTDTNHFYSWICTKCGNIFEDDLEDGKIPRCNICYPKNNNNISLMEKEIVEFIKSLNIDLIENDRSILEGKELDIYIPSHKVAIEFDGLYWHSELNGKDKKYHLNKTFQCQEKGIQLIHIFEDEWIDKQEIVKSIITAKLGLITNKIFARKCEIKEVPNDEAKLFLFDNHLQGPINGKHIGLYYEDELISLLTIGKSRFNKNYQYEILRFCNKVNVVVVGGLSRLLRQIDSNSIITYADLRYGTGDSYLKCNFKQINKSLPSYSYLKDNHRFSRLNFQKHLLSEKLDIFDPNLTEWQNMQLNGYDRIWDCGNNILVRCI